MKKQRGHFNPDALLWTFTIIGTVLTTVGGRLLWVGLWGLLR